MNMSYRQAWSLVDQLNQAFIEPVVISQTGGKSGGGAALTEFGKLLVAHCTAIIANAKKTSGPHLEFIAAVLRPVAGKPAVHDEEQAGALTGPELARDGSSGSKRAAKKRS